MSSRTIGLFVEDDAHKEFVTALVNRFTREYEIAATIHERIVTGGHGKVINEFERYLKDLHRHGEGYFDGVIVATDANCEGFLKRLKELKRIDRHHSIGEIIYAIPDPHVERWFLLDSAAFRQILGRGCKAPDQKCRRDRYKQALRTAIAEAGVTPLLGGIEYAESLVEVLDLKRVEKLDKSLRHFLRALRGVFNSWTQGDSA
jgi:hypothetical protein